MTGFKEIQPRIITSAERKLIGQRLTMTFADNQTFKLWQSFMPRRKEIKSVLTADLISMQVFPHSFDFTFVDQNAPFEKWAAVEVGDFDFVPNEMETFSLKAGLYAVFDYKGLSTDTSIFSYIFGIWLPDSSKYMLDSRPHFEILGERYKIDDPNSEEEIWIPVRAKN